MSLEHRQLWKVVGGSEKGGIIVRMGQDVGSPQLTLRLATGSVLKELSRVGDRIHYERLTGSGPLNGWVSLRSKDKALLVPTDATSLDEGESGSEEEVQWHINSLDGPESAHPELRPQPEILERVQQPAPPKSSLQVDEHPEFALHSNRIRDAQGEPIWSPDVADNDSSAATASNALPVSDEEANIAETNAQRVLGDLQLPEDASRPRVPQDWAMVSRGRDLFIAGWGGFDVLAAHQAFCAHRLALEAEDSQGSTAAAAAAAAAVPSVQVLRSYGYREKFFPQVQQHEQCERLRRILLLPQNALARYLVRHCKFWSQADNCSRLQEVERHFENPKTAAIVMKSSEEPRALLNRLARLQAVTQHKFIRFHHLLDACPSSMYFGGDEGAEFIVEDPADANPCAPEFVLLQDSHAVARAAWDLNNCAATYIADINRKRCALFVLRQEGKLVAMGEWDLHDRRWSQISEHNDEPARAAWEGLFRLVASHNFLYCNVTVELPDRSDGVSIFNQRAADTLRPMLARLRGGGATGGIANTELQAVAKRHSEAADAVLLWAVVTSRSRGALEEILRHGAQGDATTDKGWTSLMIAVDKGMIETAGLLLKHGADVNAKGPGGQTALMFAADSGHLQSVMLLLESKADLQVVDRLRGETALLKAVERRHWQVATSLVNKDCGLDARRFDGRTALSLAARLGKTDLVRTLLEHAADLEVRDDEGLTPLLAAQRDHDSKTAYTLLRLRANPETMQLRGSSLLK